ncbi:MAG: endonuclease III [Bacteroidales bacterium]|nr:endonuclease III [Bacteroidales bacterium]
MEGKIVDIIAWFEKERPVANSELVFDNPFQLLVSVILSAQCTDKRVNMVTPALFSRFPTAGDLAEASFEEVYELIKSISYPNNKAKHLIGMAKMLENDFGGTVPDNVEDLQKLPGVGRKTANVVASIVYNRAVIAVDTHVFRVARRLGLSRGKTPLAVEKDLTAQIGEDLRPIAHHWLILHGRYVCIARKPKCDECGLRSYCDYYEQKNGNDA